MKQSEQRFRKLVEHSSDVITLLDADGRIVFSTDSIRATLGYAPEEKIGHSVFELIDPEDRRAAEPLFRDVLQVPGRAARADLRVQHKDGSWRDLEVVAVNRLDDAAINAIVVNYHDITERKRGADQLRRTMESVSLAHAVAHIGTWEWDIARNVVTWSDETYRIFGVAPAAGQMSVADYIGLIHPEDRDAVREAVSGAIETRTPFEVDHRIVRPDGSLRSLHGRGGMVSDSTGRPLRLIGAVLDVTDVKRLEQQFLQAQKMEAVGQLAGGVAHDFNNLLTIILGSTELVLDTLPSDHPGREDAEETRKAALRAAELTRQLLAFSSQQLLAPRVLSLNEVVANMDRMLQRSIGDDVELRTVLAQDLGAVRADPGQLEHVIVNLAVNARDAMPRGGKLTIETANVALDAVYAPAHAGVVPGAYVMLAVSDTGTGMDAATQARVFEPFFTTKGKGKGTGLGLATAYGIVKQSEGYVWVYSEPDRGTTFKIYLPRIDAPVERASPDPIITASLRGSETILLVEDQDAVRGLIHKMLAARGYQVFVAANGPEAVRLGIARRGGIDLLVTDVVMPGMTGREVSQRLAPAYPKMKVLYLSGYTDESIAHHGMLEPGIAFLQKPFTADALARKVREVLGESPLSR